MRTLLRLVHWLLRVRHRCEWCGAPATTVESEYLDDQNPDVMRMRSRRFCDVHAWSFRQEWYAWTIGQCKRCAAPGLVFIKDRLCKKCRDDRAQNTCLLCGREDPNLHRYSDGPMCEGCRARRGIQLPKEKQEVST